MLEELLTERATKRTVLQRCGKPRAAFQYDDGAEHWIFHYDQEQLLAFSLILVGVATGDVRNEWFTLVEFDADERMADWSISLEMPTPRAADTKVVPLPFLDLPRPEPIRRAPDTSWKSRREREWQERRQRSW